MSTYMKNIKINYLFLIKDINITQGIWMLYLASKGLSLLAIGSLEAVFHITSFIMETPTGVVADLFGRKNSRLVGLVFAAVSSVVFVCAGGYWGFAAGFVLSALSYNFESGAGEALIYDSLLAERRENRFMHYTGRYEMVFQSVSVAGLLLGGALGNIEYRWVYYASVFFSVVALFIGCFFKEPPIADEKTPNKKTSLLSAVRAQYRDSFSIIKASARLTYLIIFINTILAATTMTFFYIQLSLKNIGLTPFKIGLVLVLSAGAAIAGAALAKKAHRRWGEQKLIISGALVISLSIGFCAFTRISILPLCLIMFTEALLFVASRDYINKLIPSRKRATLLSFDSMVFSFCMIAMFPLFGYVADHIGLSATFLVFGGGLTLFTFVGALIKKE